MSYIEKFWRPATDKDVVDVMASKEVEARFRDGATESWVEGLRLGGWAKDNRYPWLDESRSGWTHCQVYDPPQWFLDKPEPGEGYRLLEKFPDEALRAGDEVFDLRGDGKWELSFNVETKHPQNYSSWYRRRIEQPKPDPGEGYRLLAKLPDEALQPGDEFFANGQWWPILLDRQYPQDEGTWCRRKIEQPKPEPKHYVLQVGDTVEFPGGHLIKIVDRPTEQMHYTLKAGDTISTPSGRQAIVTEHGVEVT